MQRFWKIVTEPVLGALQPETLVEIGSAQGGNTEKILEYCHRHGATLHVIDPAPGYDVEEWQRRHGKRLIFHKDLSLRVLPKIKDFDVILIDGDHNWYTVYNELKLIEKTCKENPVDFPLVMLHDVGWPYGRRDLYYAPETIPEEYRKPHEKKGMLPGVPELVEEGGMNQHLQNAVLEHEPRSGVLTAVEDFLGGSRYELELLELPGIHGFGILTPVRLKEQNPDLAGLLSRLDFSPFVENYVRGVEKARLELEIRQQEEHREYRQRLAEKNQEIREERQKLRREQQFLREERQNLAEARQRNNEILHEMNFTRRDLNEAKKDVLQLKRWLEGLDEGVSALQRSRQWKVGSAVGGLYRRVTSRAGAATPDEHLEAILRKFRAWRGAGRNW